MSPKVIWSRYKFTITLVLIVAFFLIPIVTYRVGESNRCENRGGTLVKTFGGYECVQTK